MTLGNVDTVATDEVTVNAESVIDQFSLQEIVDYLGAGDLLDEIGEKEAIEHFGIEVAE